MANNEKLNYTEPTPQERLDTIMKAFRRLPPAELSRLGVDVSENIVDGTPAAEHVLKAWSDRQEELKKAMKSLMQPAELMAKITQQLQDIALSLSEKEQALIDLESLLADIDNSRDFHTLGSWPVLVSLLTDQNPLSIRTLAAWSVGTAVKNSYDYQLWVLEPVEASSVLNGVKITHRTNALQLLLDNLSESYDSPASEKHMTQGLIDFQKRTLYAISSAARGNLDVQEYIQKEQSGDTLSTGLIELTLAPETSVEVERKIWSFVEDMLQEVHYIRQELQEELARLTAAAAEQKGTSDVNGEGSAVNVTAAVEVSMDGEVQNSVLTPLQSAVEAVRNMQLLGDLYIDDDRWLGTGASELRQRVTELLTIVNGRHTAVVVDEEGVEQVVTILGAGMDKNHVLAVQKVTLTIVQVLADILKLRTAGKGLDTNSTTVEAVHSDSFKAACGVLKKNELMATLQDISILNGDEMFEELIPATQELLGLLSMCSVSGSGTSRNM